VPSSLAERARNQGTYSVSGHVRARRVGREAQLQNGNWCIACSRNATGRKAALQLQCQWQMLPWSAEAEDTARCSVCRR